MTMIFKPDELSIQNAPLGKRVRLLVLGHAKNDKVQAVAVNGVLSKNNNAHVTLSVDKARGGKPVDSNRLLDQALNDKSFQKLEAPLYLNGIIDTYPRTTGFFPLLAQWIRRQFNG